MKTNSPSTQTFTDETTAKVADLIKIQIPQQDLPNYTKQLNQVMQSVPVLQELDTKDIEPTAQTHGLENVSREDEPTVGLDMSNYKNTQNFRKGYFVVKKVI